MVELGFEELFVRFWWLIFPLFGIEMAFWGMASHERRGRWARDLIESYVKQGKEPPAELLRIASGEQASGGPSGSYRGNRAWTLIVFTAVAVGFGLAAAYTHNEQTQIPFMIVAGVMGVLAFGAFLILMFESKPEK